MDISALSFLGKIVNVVFLSAMSLFIQPNANQQDAAVENLNKIRNTKVAYEVAKQEVPAQVAPTQPVEEVTQPVVETPAYNVIRTFTGTMTGYGPDCPGCSGRVACKPGQNVTNGNIYYNDSQFGKVRIVAADRNYACGTIVRISNSSVFAEPIIAVVMDRGGKITGNKMDLLYESNSAVSIGHPGNIQYEILRESW